MGFSERYIGVCVANRQMFRSKKCFVGDWYIDAESGWAIDVHHPGGLTMVRNAESLHWGMFNALVQMSVAG